MSCISALCMVLALSSFAASAESKDRVEQLKEEISQAVAGQLVIIANDAAAANMNKQELNKKVLASTNTAFELLKPLMNELTQISDSSPEVIAKDLTSRINQNQALKNALSKGGEISPRFSGVLGTIGTMVYDIVKATAHIMIGPTK